MDPPNEAAAAESDASGMPSPTKKRQRSQIEFPYADLESAVELARMLHTKQGTARCDGNQLATWLGQTASGGTFRTRLSAARLFGLVETDRSNVWLAELGMSALDAGTERAALVSAFLKAPLYRALYEQFEGHALPPMAALERQIVILGVSEKQKERARQTFMKSAHYAGFIDQQTGRLIKPGIAAGTLPAPPRKALGGGDGGTPPRDPLLDGLFNEVPARGTEWSAEDQVRWLETAAHIFALVFKRRERIKIEIVQDSRSD
jgi:hypothetical protein